MKKIAIFGGTFDPFTIAHKEIVKQLFEYVKVDKVIVSPTVTNWYRDKDDVWLTDIQRIDCCEKAISSDLELGDKEVSVNTYDINRKLSNVNADNFVKTWHYIDTLEHLRAAEYTYRKDCGLCEFYTVIGSDQLERFKEWHRWEDILKMSKLIVINNRNGKHVESDVPHIDIEISKEFWNVSATELRSKYKGMKDGLVKYLKTFDPPKTPEPELLLQHTPIFDLVQKPAPYDDMPDFKPVGINAPDWVTVIAEHNGKFCCVKQLRFGIMKECEEFIAGQVDDNENPVYAARRELLEETGIRLEKGVADLQYLGKFDANPAFMNNCMHYFYVNLDSAEFVQVEKRLDEHERLETYWKDKHKLVDDYMKDRNSVFMAGGLLLLEKLAHALS